ncbi:MAG: YdcF family protein [Pseudomonadota bacterium]
MNSLFVLLGIEAWKPLIAALLLPPVPFLFTAMVGTRLVFWRRTIGWLVVVLSVVALWLSSCTAVSLWLQQALLRPPAALSADARAAVKRDAAGKNPAVAIVVLGNGRELLAPEYGLTNLQHASLERLRYGLWLSKETGAPVAYSGGVGYGQPSGAPEAEIAARIAAQEFGRPLRWTETESRDTRENAARTVPLLRAAGVTQIVLVTHGYHMRRAVRAFEQAAAVGGAPMQIVPAPMGLAQHESRQALRWMPTNEGFTRTRNVLREAVGLVSGA